MPYSAEISRSNPTAFVFLLDQSSSMLEPFGGQPEKRKADGVADALNRLLQNLVLKCAKNKFLWVLSLSETRFPPRRRKRGALGNARCECVGMAFVRLEHESTIFRRFGGNEASDGHSSAVT